MNFKLVKSENGLGSEETYNALGYTSAHINDNLIRISKDFGLIFTFSFSENVKFAIDNPEANADSLSNKATAELIRERRQVRRAIEERGFPFRGKHNENIRRRDRAGNSPESGRSNLTFVLKTDSDRPLVQ